MSDIEREEFEQAVTDRWSDSYSFTRFGDEDYYDEVLEGMWRGWQASRQAVSVPGDEYIIALQDAFDIIQADANTEQNYGSLCRMGGILGKLKAKQEQDDDQ